MVQSYLSLKILKSPLEQASRHSSKADIHEQRSVTRGSNFVALFNIFPRHARGFVVLPAD